MCECVHILNHISIYLVYDKMLEEMFWAAFKVIHRKRLEFALLLELFDGSNIFS